MSFCAFGQGEGFTLTGRVISESTGEPVPRGWVIATPLAPGPTRSFGGKLQTDGSFQVHGLEAGTYVLNVQAPGFADTLGFQRGNANRTVQLDASGARLRDSGGEVLLRMQPLGVIAGTVLDEDGFPVERAQVMAAAVSADGSRPSRKMSGSGASTDDRGAFRLSGLSAGTYLLHVTRHSMRSAMNVEDRSTPGIPSQRNAVVSAAFYPSAASVDDAAVVTLGPGEELQGQDIRFPAIAGGIVSGVVLSQDNRPLPHTHVGIVRISSRPVPFMQNAFAPADDSGQFTSQPLAPGEYLLTAQSGDPRQGEAQFARARVQVGGTGGTHVELRMQPLLRVQGSISSPPLPKELIASGRTGPHVGVQLEPDAPEGDMVKRMSMASPPRFLEDGGFQMHPVWPGVFRLMVSVPVPTWYVAEATLAGQDLLRGSANLESASGTLPMRVVLREGAAQLDVTVEGLEDAAHAGCFVRLYSVDDRNGSSPNLRQEYCAEGGKVAINRIAPGSHKLFLFTPEEVQEADLDALAAARWADAPTVTLSARDKKSITIRKP